MTTQVQFRRGTTTQHASFTGAQGEITVDIDKKTAIIHDGATVGGIELARADGAIAMAIIFGL
jgi:ribulose 1,5-bisphosphate synthetase/thiazole synthase